MAVLTRPTVKRIDWHGFVFTAVAALFSLLFLVVLNGSVLLLWPWRIVMGGGAGPEVMFPEMHRWHGAQAGTMMGLFFGGTMVALLRGPREKPLLMQFYALMIVVFNLLQLAVTGFDPALLVITMVAAVPVVAYPAPRALADFSRERGFSKPLLALAAVAALLIAPYAWESVQLQLAHAGGEHATLDHWLHSAHLCLFSVMAGGLAATKRPGWQTLGLLTGAAFFYLGVAAITVPHHDGSWGMTGGVISMVGGAAFIVATLWEARRALPTR